MKTITKLYESSEIPPYAQALINRQKLLDDRLDELHSIINKAEKGAMGLTKDEAKTPEWKAAKAEYAQIWKGYQAVNSELAKLRKSDGFDIVDGKRVTKYKYKK